MEFREYPKIARWNREIVISEKIDGTNAQILIVDPKEDLHNWGPLVEVVTENAAYNVYAGSRNRWLTPGKSSDNHGFAGWVVDNAIEIVNTLGPGCHYGEFWGQGIQRGYGMKRKAFSLFNASRWSELPFIPKEDTLLHVVPVIYSGPNVEHGVAESLRILHQEGSMAAPGYTDPEGIVIFHTAANTCFKVTLKDDETPKSLVKA